MCEEERREPSTMYVVCDDDDDPHSQKDSTIGVPHPQKECASSTVRNVRKKGKSDETAPPTMYDHYHGREGDVLTERIQQRDWGPQYECISPYSDLPTIPLLWLCEMTQW
ncbi:hypothetical protein ACROYT_G037544 [Oculina patagonica]